MTNERPNPDQLLAEVQQREAKQHRGRLKIFFGMAAGVGKTYAMLEEARKRAAEGADVLVGYAEPHIRTDTEALLLGMEILPYKIVEYRNAQLKEFDLDAALVRKPAIVLVDELAHTNAPGLRHPKRWQDVFELLDAGINVYTTLNVQHVESVNDIVERITGVRVRETLPDAVLEQADEVELVDIAPEELLERFREGRVYRPDIAERASKHFFTKGNLIALRELALRTTAQRVDAQMQEARRDAGVRSTWAATERVLVGVGPSPTGPRLVRAAKRLATSLRADWVAVYVETGPASRLGDADRRRVDQTIRLAEELAARTVTLSGESVADEVIAYAQSHNVTKIVVGKPEHSRWRDWAFGSVVDDLVRRSGEIDIHVIRAPADDAAPSPRAPAIAPKRDWNGYLWAIGIVAVTTAIGWPLLHYVGVENENVLMLYLLGVLWVALRHSRAAAILASILAVAAFDFSFVPPYLTFAITDEQYMVTFGVMLTTALVISTLTHRVRNQAEASRRRERHASTLFALSRELAGARTSDEIAESTARHIADAVGSRAVVLMTDADRRLVTKADSAQTTALDAKEFGVAQWAYEHEQPAGRGTNTLPAASGTYVPLKSPRGSLGVLGMMSDDATTTWSGEQRQLIEAFATQAALAPGARRARGRVRQAWEHVEAEFLRNTLLSGVSHELRTPLAAITGASSALAETGDALPAAARREMLDTIVTESERMERLINNLLDMTRLESGGLALKREWLPLQEVVGSSLRHLQRRLQDRALDVSIPNDLPLVFIDPVAFEQVLNNLIENAIDHTPPKTPIELGARSDGASVTIEVSDHGSGIPTGTERRVFDKFFRAAPTDSPRGIGLGLAIVRGIVEAHGGTITAANRPAGGAAFTISLPLTGAPPVVDASG